jgi:thiol-disulfide isomerase/thioredoxin
MIHLSIALSLLAVLVSSAAIAAPPAPQERAMLAAGDRLEDFEAEGLDGRVRQVSFQGRPTVLMFFLSSCPTCHKMIPEWNRAYERRPEGLQVVAVLLDREPPGFFMSMPVEFPVVRAPTRQFAAGLGVHRVPFTARVGPDGVVQNAANGVLDPITLGEYFRP